MADYRIFVLNERRRISSPAVIVSCESDDEAVQNAHAYVNRTGVEVWNGDRLVAELAPTSKDSDTQQVETCA